MRIETGVPLYAMCDCMNNFKKGQEVTVEIAEDGIVIDSVVTISKDIIEKYFTDNPFYSEKYDDKHKIEKVSYYDTMTTYKIGDKFILDGIECEVTGTNR